MKDKNHYPTIEKLRKSGYKVRVIHKEVESDDPYSDIANRLTLISILDLNGNEWYGESRCSKKDQYNRKLGNKIALHRALKKFFKFYLENPTNDDTIEDLL